MKKMEFPFFEVEDTWKKKHDEKYGTVVIIPVEIQVKLESECPKVNPEWSIFATNYQTGKLPNETVTAIYQRLNLRFGDSGIKRIGWINCIVKAPGFNITEKWDIIGWLFSLCLDEVPS